MAMSAAELDRFKDMEASRDRSLIRAQMAESDVRNLRDKNKELQNHDWDRKMQIAGLQAELNRALGWIDNAQGFPPGGEQKDNPSDDGKPFPTGHQYDV